MKRKNKKKYNKVLENKKNIYNNTKLKSIQSKNIIQLKNVNNNKNKTTEKKKIKKKINNKDKKLFILLPTYNRGQLSTNVIHQVLKQTSNKWKLLIINDGSNDEETKILEDYLSLTKNSQIEYIKNEKNIGLPKTLNKGIRKFLDSDEDFFTWISDDNFYYDIFVEELVKSNKCFTYSFWKLNNNVMEKKYDKFTDLLNWTGLGVYMWNRSTIEKIGFYNENLTSVEDYDFIIRTYLLIDIDDINCIETVLMNYYNNTENSLSLKYKSKIRKLTILIKKFYNFIYNRKINLLKSNLVKGHKNRLSYDEKNKLIILSPEYFFLV